MPCLMLARQSSPIITWQELNLSGHCHASASVLTATEPAVSLTMLNKQNEMSLLITALVANNFSFLLMLIKSNLRQRPFCVVVALVMWLSRSQSDMSIQIQSRE